MSTTRARLTDWLASFVVELFVFAQLSDERELDPDTAVKWLESIVGTLGELTGSDRLWLHEFVKRAEREESHPDRRRALAAFADEVLTR